MNSQRRVSGPNALGILLSAALFLSSCLGEPPALTIGDVEYTESELLTFNADRRTRLAELTAFGLAVARGEIDTLGVPLVARREREALLDALEREMTLRFAGVEEEALRARYDAAPEYELTVRHLVILVGEWATEDEVASARARAQGALERIRGGEPFDAVAGEVSEEPGAAERGGLLQPGRNGTWVDEFWNAANGLEVGQVSSVIRTPYGFHVLKLEARDPIPFAEARNRVVEQVAALVPPQDEALAAWVDSTAAVVRVDSSAVLSAFQEAGSLFGFAQSLADASSLAVASWPGGGYDGPRLRRFLIGLERPEWEYVSNGSGEDLLRVVTDAAHRAYLGSVAAEEGVTLPPGKKESLRRDWRDSAAGWAQALDFREGMRVDALKAAAILGVSSSAQGARIARTELHGWGPMLLAAYPIGPEG